MPEACTAATIATDDPEYRTVTDDAAATAAWLETMDYDSAPVYADGSPVGYVTPELLADVADGATLETCHEPLRIDVVVAADADFESVLDALYDRPFYYLADRDRVTGVLTRADLNTEPVYSHLYVRLSRLERVLRECIAAHAPEWLETTNLHPETVDGIERRLTDATQAGVNLPPVHYAQFSTLVRVATEHEACWESLGFSSSGRASSQLDGVVDLRNDVAHSTPIVQNTDRGLTASGRTITALEDQYQTIRRVLSATGTGPT